MKKVLMLLVCLVSVCSLLGAVGAYMDEKRPAAKSAHDEKEGDRYGHEAVPMETEKKANPIPFEAESVSRGEAHYGKYCLGCHGAAAKGDGPMADKLPHRPADLIHAIADDPEGKLAWIIANGYGKMPAWKSVLSEKDIWDVLNYLKMLEQRSK